MSFRSPIRSPIRILQYALPFRSPHSSKVRSPIRSFICSRLTNCPGIDRTSQQVAQPSNNSLIIPYQCMAEDEWWIASKMLISLIDVHSSHLTFSNYNSNINMPLLRSYWHTTFIPIQICPVLSNWPPTNNSPQNDPTQLEKAAPPINITWSS